MADKRGDDPEPDAKFSYVSAQPRVPKEHPLRAIRALVDEVLRNMSHEFVGLYARVGRPSIPPERLLRAQLLQIFYSIRSQRVLMEQLDYNLLRMVCRHGHGRADLGADRHDDDDVSLLDRSRPRHDCAETPLDRLTTRFNDVPRMEIP